MKWFNQAAITWAATLTFVLVIFSVSPSASYDLGRTYEYDYVTSVVLNEQDAARGKNVTYQVIAKVATTTVWQDPSNQGRSLLLLQVSDPSLHVVPKGSIDGQLSKHHSNLENFKDGNIVLQLEQGKGFTSIFADDREPNDFLSLKGGIASLFQFQAQDKERLEVDSSGQCTAIYESAGKVVHKFKKNCVTTLPNEHAERRIRSNKVLGVGIASEFQSTYALNKEQVISSVETLETQQLTLNAFERVGAFIQAKQKLNLIDDEDGSKLLVKGNSVTEAIVALSKVLQKEITPRSFHSPTVTKESSDNCPTLPEYVHKKQKALKTENLAKLNTATTFLDLVQRFRLCDKTVLTKILKNSKNKIILPQLLDVAAAAQTSAAIESVLAVLNFNGDSIDLPERFLYAVSTIPYPDEKIVQIIVNLVKSGSKSAKLSETLLLAAGSLTKAYYQLHGNDKVVDGVISLFVSKLSHCKDIPCKLPYLRALRNAAIPSSIPTLIAQVKSGGKTGAEALRAIKALPTNAFHNEIKTVLIQVYHQLLTKHETTARILAAEILLEKYVNADVINSLLITMGDRSVEVKSYVLQKLNEISATDVTFRNLVRQALRNPLVGNYNVLAQGGGSTTFTNLLAGDENANATYGLHLEMISGSLPKRSDFTIGLNYKDSSLNFFTCGLYASGLASLAGETTSDDEASDEEMSAGIELNILGVGLRPYTLFTGQGEVMGHVWSGTASESTPIFTGNFLLHDHRQSFALQNGFVLQMSILGALSLDMSGSIQTSLWNRNAHTVIQDKASVVVQSMTRVDSSFINSHVSVNTGAEASLEFVTDIEFAASPFKLCTQMGQPPFTLRRLVSKVENIPGSKHRLRRTRRLVQKVPGRSFLLNRKNSELCTIMLGSGH